MHRVFACSQFGATTNDWKELLSLFQSHFPKTLPMPTATETGSFPAIGSPSMLSSPDREESQQAVGFAA